MFTAFLFFHSHVSGFNRVALRSPGLSLWLCPRKWPCCCCVLGPKCCVWIKDRGKRRPPSVSRWWLESPVASLGLFRVAGMNQLSLGDIEACRKKIRWDSARWQFEPMTKSVACCREFGGPAGNRVWYFQWDCAHSLGSKFSGSFWANQCLFPTRFESMVTLEHLLRAKVTSGRSLWGAQVVSSCGCLHGTDASCRTRSFPTRWRRSRPGRSAVVPYRLYFGSLIRE